MGNPIQRFLGFLASPSHSRTASILAILIIALAIPLTVLVAQKQQDLRQHASDTTATECAKNGGYCDNGVCAKLENKCLYDSYATGPNSPSNCQKSPGAVCTPSEGDTSQSAHQYQCSQLQPSYSCTEIAPAESCPLGLPLTQGGSPWGSDCSSVGEGTPARPFHITDTTCYYAKCERLHSNPKNPLCWYNSGVTSAPLSCPSLNPTLPAPAACTTDPAGWTAVCTLPSSPVKSTNKTTDSTCNSNDCPPCNNHTAEPACAQYGVANTLAVKKQDDGGWYCFNTSTKSYLGFAACATSAALTDCTQNTGACQAAANSCNITNGTWTLDKLAGGSTNCTPKPNTPCTLSSPATCTSPNTCNSSNQCVAPSGGNAATCRTDVAGAVGCTSNSSSCSTINGVLNRCYLYNSLNNSSICSSACTAVGPWCTPDSTCSTSAPPPGNAGNTISVTFNVGLDGIGNLGDRNNPSNTKSNQSPKTNPRPFQIQLFSDPAGTIPVTVANSAITTVPLTFNASGNLPGRYTNPSSTPAWTPAVSAAVYSIRISTYGHLAKLITLTSPITAGQTTITLNPVNLSAGNLNQEVDKVVNSIDYGLLGQCAFQVAPTSGLCQAADLDDSGTVDLADLNLLLRDYGLTGD